MESINEVKCMACASMFYLDSGDKSPDPNVQYVCEKCAKKLGYYNE